jgi:signal recognition particle receptor subunit beta
MTDNLLSYDQDPDQFPMVLQYNKRDIASPIPLGSLEETLALKDVPVLEAVAVNNQGVLETIRSISRRVIERFQI